LVLDQLNDTTDTGSAYQRDLPYPKCNQKSFAQGMGRHVSGGTTRSQQQLVYPVKVQGSGSGPYTVTITPGIYANNWRVGQSPGVWWEAGILRNAGIEDLTLDNTDVVAAGITTDITLAGAYHSWVKNVRSILAGRNHVMPYISYQNIVRDSYFYGSRNQGSPQSYGVWRAVLCRCPSRNYDHELLTRI
jgi:hypothetical protein